MSEDSNPWVERPSSIEAFAAGDHIAPEALAPVLAREGLPRGYRMRADSHYVDQLSAASAGQPVRLIPVAHIDDDGDQSSPSELRPLIESVRLHGIVHPLLVRRQHSRYAIVAGRKRLAAARTLTLDTVPCLVHEIGDAEAAAMAAADNLSVATKDRRNADTAERDDVHRLVADHCARIGACGDLLPANVSGLDRPAVDLIKAHAWRTARLIDALNLVSNGLFEGRARALPMLIEEVIEGFAPESRLTGIVMRSEAVERLPVMAINGGELIAGLAGALLATLPLVERANRPTITVRASTTDRGALALDVIQTDAPVPPRLPDHFFDEHPPVDRPGGDVAALGAKAAQALARRYGGTAAFTAAETGSCLSMLLIP